MNEFAHRRADDHHLRFAGGPQPRLQRAKRWIEAERGQRGKVERFAETSRSDLHEATSSAERARFADTWHDAGEGRGLARAAVAFIKELGDQHGGGRLADARNAGQQVALLAQAGVLVQVIPNLSLHGFDFRGERREDGLERGADGRDHRAGLEPIGFLRLHALQGVEPPDQRLQFAHLARRRRPGGRLLRGRVAGDQLRVDPVRLRARQLTGRKRVRHRRDSAR